MRIYFVIALILYSSLQTQNLKRVFFTVRYALQLLPPGLSALFISSLAANRGFPGSSPYNAAKTGIIMLAKAFAHELATNGIRANVITRLSDTTIVQWQMEFVN